MGPGVQGYTKNALHSFSKSNDLDKRSQDRFFIRTPIEIGILIQKLPFVANFMGRRP